MDPDLNIRRLWFSCAAVMVLTVITIVADRAQQLTPLRTAVHDVLSPGRLILLSIAGSGGVPSVPPGESDSDSTGSLQAQLARNELQRRQFLIENAQLRNELQRLRAGHNESVLPGDSLIQFRRLSARILSRKGMPGKLREMLIDVGRQHGLRRSELLLDETGMLIDQGQDDGAVAGSEVLSGLSVVGRISRSGRWVSAVQPITGEGFTAQAQLMRQSDLGAHFGAKGLLEGTGDDQCRLVGVAYTEPVSIGDSVCSVGVDGLGGPRLYFGTVVHAEFVAGGEWNIRVLPAVTGETIDKVTVVQANLNQRRIESPRVDP